MMSPNASLDYLKLCAQFILLQYEMRIPPPFEDTVPKHLRTVSEEYERHRMKKDIGFIAGSSTGIIGGGLAIAGFALIPVTFGGSLALSITGTAIGVLGAFAGITVIVENYFRDKGFKEEVESANYTFMALRNDLAQLAVYIDAVFEIVKSIEKEGGINGTAIENGIIKIRLDEMEEELDECKDLQTLTKTAVQKARDILLNLKEIVRADEILNSELELDRQIDEVLNFGPVQYDKRERQKTNLSSIIRNRLEIRRRQTAERNRLMNAVKRLLSLDMANIEFAPINFAMLFLVFFTEQENVEAPPDKNEKANSGQGGINEKIAEAEPVITLESVLLYLVDKSANQFHLPRVTKTALSVGETIYRVTRVGRITADTAELGQTTGTTVVRVSRGIPVVGLIFGVVGVALDAASLGIAAYDLHKCRKKIKANFSREMSDLAEIMSTTNSFFQ